MHKLIGLAAASTLVIVGAPALARGGHGGGHGGSHSGSGHSSRSSSGEHYTSAHVTRSGSYVRGHYSTNPNATRNDNYSTRGNTNPHTGEEGTKPRDGEAN